MKHFIQGALASLGIVSLVLLVLPVMFRLFDAWFTFVKEF